MGSVEGKIDQTQESIGQDVLEVKVEQSKQPIGLKQREIAADGLRRPGNEDDELDWNEHY